ncbi:hypothetical protein A5712_18575 [Mycobacterium sp. E2327]|nr:hypothetical protein A5712_18575 [Mycobacterium sp. E2327]
MVLVSPSADFSGGGGAVGFRDVVVALRERRPDLDLVAVYPQKGAMEAECTRHGVRTEVARIGWWMYGEGWRGRLRVPFIEALVGVLVLPLGTAIVGALLLIDTVRAVLLLNRLRPTIVFTNTLTVAAHAIAAKLLGITHYWMVSEFGRDDFQLRFLFGYRRSMRLIGRLSESVICSSHAIERTLLEIDPTMATHIVYPVVDTPLGTPPERHPGEPLRVVLAGRFSPAKGQQLAVQAVARARKAGVDIELTLVGAGSQAPLRKLARRLGVEELVTIHGPTDDLAPFWSAAHVGLMCSQCEGFGRVTVEAMRAGLPVCGTNAGATPEIIDAGVNGLLSPPGDSNTLAANLMALESDEELRRKLAFGAVETAERFQRVRHDDDITAILGLN